ncbi:hypothetical protein JTB14_026417 [Gonioctena quinquepunctata]|nr:hypothetical protein JTB14_026417 [Gonioctena quinquepunctata]
MISEDQEAHECCTNSNIIGTSEHFFVAFLRKIPRQIVGNGIIKKIIRLVKLIVILVVIIVKVVLLLKVTFAVIKFKYMLITFGYLVLSYLKFWLEAKRHAKEDKVAHYKHATHDHHFDPIENEFLEEDLIHEDWRRDDDAGYGAQAMAYAHHKPFFSI